jgi:thioredoxin 1
MRQIKYFSAPWCGPCRLFKPIMEELKMEGLNIQFFDVDEDHNEVSSYGIRSVPTCVLLENGKEIDRWSGSVSKSEVKRKYNAIL